MDHGQQVACCAGEKVSQVLTCWVEWNMTTCLPEALRSIGDGLLVYMMTQPLVASHRDVIRCITPDPALLPTWKDYPATERQTLRSYNHGACGVHLEKIQWAEPNRF